MTSTRLASLLCVLVLGGISAVSASGPIGVFGLIDKVVYEPAKANAERVQVWGAFAYVEGGLAQASAAS